MSDPVWLTERNYSPELLAAYKAAAKSTGIPLQFGFRKSFASRALYFAAQRPVPSAEYSIGADSGPNSRGDAVCIPYVQLVAYNIRFQFTISRESAVWRVRELGRPQGTTRTPQANARYLNAFQQLGFSQPNGYHCFWTRVPAGVIERAGPYIQDFLAAIVKPGHTGTKREKKRKTTAPAKVQATLVRKPNCAPEDHRWIEVERSPMSTLSRCSACGIHFRSMAEYRTKSAKEKAAVQSE